MTRDEFLALEDGVEVYDVDGDVCVTDGDYVTCAIYNDSTLRTTAWWLFGPYEYVDAKREENK